jgi:hypothetical protein
MRLMLLRVLLLFSSLLALHVNAQVAVPDELKSWQSWVLHGEEFRRCPFYASHQPNGSNDYVCAWPERLSINVNAQGGNFTQRWQVFSDSWVALPGNVQYWPRAVRLNGAAAPVIERSGIPHLRLSAGTYVINGTLSWSSRPEQLAIPAETGIVDLSVDGRPIAQPERPGNAVWLGKRRTAEQQKEMSMQVYRLVKDEIPVMLTTQIRLQVSGEAREELISGALPNAFIPMSISSALPARMENGDLRVQLRPGQWVITIEARGMQVATELSAPITTETGEEVWSYLANDRLRVAAIDGVEAIDPSQANVPSEWHGLPSYRMTKGSVFKVVERSRGLENQDANQLQLNRHLWLDFDHKGYTVVDNISGTMRQEWRLDIAKPFAVMSARADAFANNDAGNLLVTTGAQPELTGVELRTPIVQLHTVSRLSQGFGRMPATGWQTRFASVSGQLNLPPGHRLLSTMGDVDAPTSWSANWGLLDFFMVLIVAVGAWKLRSVVFGVLALAALVLVHQEQRVFAWLLVNALIAIALVGVAPLGKLKTVLSWYRSASLVVIALVFLPFALNQVRLALYPQLEQTSYYNDAGAFASANKMEQLPQESNLEMQESLPAAAAAPATDASADRRQDLRSRRTFSKSSQQASVSQRYAPGTAVQTGPGMPNWNFNSYAYSWSGPVDIDESVRFVIATPFWMSLWRVLGVALLGFVIVGLVRLSFHLDSATNLIKPFIKRSGSAMASSLLVALAAMLCFVPTISHATPDANLLSELKTRLTQPPVCSPSCSETLSASIVVSADKLEMTLEVSALANVAMAIPVAVGRWEPEIVAIDGQSAGAIYRDPQQNYWVALKAGAHTIRMSGRLAAAESIQLVFPQRPRAITTSGSGWEFAGVSDGRMITNAIELVRQRSSSSDKLSAATQFASFVRVRRLIQLDLDWSVVTIVERVAPEKGAFTVEIPLLKDESVLTPGITIRETNGVRVAFVGLSGGQNDISWTSALPRSESMELAMQSIGDRALDRTESWGFAINPVWNVQFEGVPQVAPLSTYAVWTFDYFPRVNETLKLAIYRPTAVSGATLAIDNVQLVADVGKRSTNNTLRFSYRSTQGGRHVVSIPKDGEVMSVTADGAPIPVRPQEGELPISLLPGAHSIEVQWQANEGAQWGTRIPMVDLKVGASNVSTRINVGDERWVLFARGEGVGPAILYWGEFVVFIVIAILLGRYTESPLRTHDWLLLGVGLSTFSWSLLLLFAVWIFVMRWRSTTPVEVSEVRFNLRQLALGALSVIAIGSLVSAIPSGLLQQPDMSVRSPSGGFSWFVDQTTSALPQAAVYSVPLIVYKIAILLWALWLSFALIRWLPWAWQAFSTNGLWRETPRRPVVKKSVASTAPPAVKAADASAADNSKADPK